MVIFHSYVKLPEGNTWTFQFWEVPEEHTSHYRDDFPPGVVLEGDRSNEPTALQVKWGEREKGQVHGGIIPEVAGKNGKIHEHQPMTKGTSLFFCGH